MKFNNKLKRCSSETDSRESDLDGEQKIGVQIFEVLYFSVCRLGCWYSTRNTLISKLRTMRDDQPHRVGTSRQSISCASLLQKKQKRMQMNPNSATMNVDQSLLYNNFSDPFVHHIYTFPRNSRTPTRLNYQRLRKSSTQDIAIWTSQTDNKGTLVATERKQIGFCC